MKIWSKIGSASGSNLSHVPSVSILESIRGNMVSITLSVTALCQKISVCKKLCGVILTKNIQCWKRILGLPGFAKTRRANMEMSNDCEEIKMNCWRHLFEYGWQIYSKAYTARQLFCRRKNDWIFSSLYITYNNWICYFTIYIWNILVCIL